MSLNTMVGFILSKTLPKCKKCPFSPFLRKKIIFQKKWYWYQNRGFWCRWIRWCGWILVKTPPRRKNGTFLLFFQKKMNYSQNLICIFVWVLKKGVFDAVKYDGVGAFKLKPFPSEKNVFFAIFCKKMKIFKKVIWVKPPRERGPTLKNT